MNQENKQNNNFETLAATVFGMFVAGVGLLTFGYFHYNNSESGRSESIKFDGKELQIESKPENITEG